MKGRSIRLFLVDGAPGGIITAEIMNWTGHVLFGPRSRLADLIQREEVKRTGVYFLTGLDPEGGYKPMVYVGETDHVGKRLAQHNKDESKDFWERVCVVTSKDQNLTKAHAKYLESRLIAVTNIVGRGLLVNSTQPDYAQLPEADTADMEFFIEQIRVVLPVLGLDFLREAPRVSRRDVAFANDTRTKPIEDVPTFELNSKKYSLAAEAKEIDGDFVVLAGSKAQREWIGQEANSSYKTLHQQLIEAGILVDEHGGEGLSVFREDYVFRSPSAASAVILGRSDNGRMTWRVKGTKKTYADWQDEQVSAVNSEGDA